MVKDHCKLTLRVPRQEKGPKMPMCSFVLGVFENAPNEQNHWNLARARPLVGSPDLKNGPK